MNNDNVYQLIKKYFGVPKFADWGKSGINEIRDQELEAIVNCNTSNDSFVSFNEEPKKEIRLMDLDTGREAKISEYNGGRGIQYSNIDNIDSSSFENETLVIQIGIKRVKILRINETGLLFEEFYSTGTGVEEYKIYTCHYDTATIEELKENGITISDILKERIYPESDYDIEGVYVHLRGSDGILRYLNHARYRFYKNRVHEQEKIFEMETKSVDDYSVTKETSFYYCYYECLKKLGLISRKENEESVKHSI